jgi:hypothetical protein
LHWKPSDGGAEQLWNGHGRKIVFHAVGLRVSATLVKDAEASMQSDMRVHAHRLIERWIDLPYNLNLTLVKCAVTSFLHYPFAAMAFGRFGPAEPCSARS